MLWKLYFIWVALSSLILFCFYAFDKSRAKRGGRRIPESTLHWLALLGGWPGGWLGRSMFRHKTRKGMFFFVLLLSTALHAYLWYRFLIN